MGAILQQAPISVELIWAPVQVHHCKDSPGVQQPAQ